MAARAGKQNERQRVGPTVEVKRQARIDLRKHSSEFPARFLPAATATALLMMYHYRDSGRVGKNIAAHGVSVSDSYFPFSITPTISYGTLSAIINRSPRADPFPFMAFANVSFTMATLWALPSSCQVKSTPRSTNASRPPPSTRAKSRNTSTQMGYLTAGSPLSPADKSSYCFRPFPAESHR